MPVDDMNFTDHLRQFFGTEVADDELKSLAIHAIANDVRRLKPAICQAVWDARQQSALGAEVNGGADRLAEARQLHAMYTQALGEFKQITQTQLPAEAVAGHDESTGRTENDSDSSREHS
jgi:hypothetical protein